MRTLIGRLSSLLFVVVTAASCVTNNHGARPEYQPSVVEGQITWNSDPVGGISIQAILQDPERTVIGCAVSDSTGHYRMPLAYVENQRPQAFNVRVLENRDYIGGEFHGGWVPGSPEVHHDFALTQRGRILEPKEGLVIDETSATVQWEACSAVSTYAFILYERESSAELRTVYRESEIVSPQWTVPATVLAAGHDYLVYVFGITENGDRIYATDLYTITIAE